MAPYFAVGAPGGALHTPEEGHTSPIEKRQMWGKVCLIPIQFGVSKLFVPFTGRESKSIREKV